MVSACSTCGDLSVEPGGDPEINPTPDIMLGTDANGCATTTVSCDGFSDDSSVILQVSDFITKSSIF